MSGFLETKTKKKGSIQMFLSENRLLIGGHKISEQKHAVRLSIPGHDIIKKTNCHIK